MELLEYPFREFSVSPTSGLLIPEEYEKRPKCFDLFCGCGGFSLGFMREGWEIVGAIDNEPNSALTYLLNLGGYPVDIHYIEPGDKQRLNKCVEAGQKDRKKDKSFAKYNLKFDTSGSGWISNHPGIPPVRNFWFGDIRKLKGKDILQVLNMEVGELDCVIGSPPCQGFTTINVRRTPTDPRNNLVFEYARLVCELQPKTMVFENVPGILNMVTPEGIPVVDALCRILEDGGMGTYEGIKKSLISTSGAGAIMTKNMEKKKKSSKKRLKKTAKIEQKSLF